MSIATNTQKNTLATAYAGAATHLSMHSADPGSTGTSELATGGYARGAITWGSASAGVITGPAAAITVAASTTVAYVGFYTASSAGTYLDKAALTVNSQPFALTVTVTPTYTQS